jgi:two-component system, cell cycle response regulator DivK
VEKCNENPDINLVLMDLKLPVMSGFEATRQIKSMRKDLPVIAITAFAMSGDESKALEAGCDDYIAKPVSKEILFSKIEKLGV